MLYVLDEPTIGLHPRDNRRLLTALYKLRDLGNTLLLVEHDQEVIAGADQLLDFGPGAGDSRGPDRRPRHAQAGWQAEGVGDGAVFDRGQDDSGADEPAHECGAWSAECGVEEAQVAQDLRKDCSTEY